MRSRRYFDLVAEHAQPRLFPVVLFLTRTSLGVILLLGGWMRIAQNLSDSPSAWITVMVGALLVLGLGTRLVGWSVAIWLAYRFVQGQAFLIADPSALAVAVILATSGAGHVWGVDGILARTKFVERNRFLRILIG